MIVLTSEGPSVEVNVQTSPAGQPLQVIETPRLPAPPRVDQDLSVTIGW